MAKTALVGTQIAGHQASHEEFVRRYYARSRDVTRSQDEVLEAMGIREIRDDALDRAVQLSEELAAAAKAGESAAEALEEMKALIVAARTDDNTKVAALRENLDDVGAVLVKILKLLL